MKFQKPKLLLDANLSPESADYLRQLGFDVKCLIEESLGDLNDDEVVHVAISEKRVVITFDLDFGEIYYFAYPKKFNVLVMRLSDQRVESVNGVLKNFFENNKGFFTKQTHRLAVVSESEIRKIL